MPGVKETLELLDGVEVLAKTGGEIFADGKVNFADLPKLGELGKNFSTLKDAAQGIDLIDDELKDLDQEEIMQILGKVFGIVKAVKGTLTESSNVD